MEAIFYYKDGSTLNYHDGSLNVARIVWENGTEEYYKDGKLHRDGGLPALIHSDGTKEYYINGLKRSQRLAPPLDSQYLSEYYVGQYSFNYVAANAAIDPYYRQINCFTFAGTNQVGLPVQVRALIKTNHASFPVTCRLYDRTNRKEIAKINSSSIIEEIVDTAELFNLPEDPAIFEVQLKVEGINHEGVISSFDLIF
jgi:hypothetical protein